MAVTEYEDCVEQGSHSESDHEGNASAKGSDEESDKESDNVSNSGSEAATDESEKSEESDAYDEAHSDDEDDYRETTKTYLCCKCGKQEFDRMNECWSWKCSDCRHTKCYDCTKHDRDDLSVLGSEDDNEDEYIINDREAEQDIISPVEAGPVSLKFLIPLLDKVAAGRYSSMADEIQSRISSYVLMPDERVIPVRWKHIGKRWRYRGIPVPVASIDIPGSFIKSVTREYLKPAPALLHHSSTPPDINYTMDVMFFEYLRCGTRYKDDEEYLDAMADAAKILELHQSLKGPKIREVKVSWCQRAKYFSNVLGLFKDIDGLEKVTLMAHDHYRGDYHRISCDMCSMERDYCTVTLEGYPFEVDLIGHDGRNIPQIAEKEEAKRKARDAEWKRASEKARKAWEESGGSYES